MTFFVKQRKWSSSNFPGSSRESRQGDWTLPPPGARGPWSLVRLAQTPSYKRGHVNCTYAKALKLAGLTEQPITSRAMAAQLADYGHLVSKSTINRHRSGGCSCHTVNAEIDQTETERMDTESGRVDVGPDGGEFTDIKTREPLTNWDHVFERFHLDPGGFALFS